jgi:CRP-like cAMP-binding protein
VGEGKTILEFRKDEIVFSQGDVADTVFYIQKGRVKLVVISEQGKEAVVGILETGHDPGSVGILSGRALVSLRFSPGCPVGEPLNELESNELSVMPNRKSPSTGPMSVQPIEHSSTGPTQQLVRRSNKYRFVWSSSDGRTQNPA